MLASIDLMAEHNPDYDSIISELLSVLQKIAIAQVLPEDSSNQIVKDQTLRTLTEIISKEDVQLFYQIGLMGRRDLAIAPDPRTGFEMVMTRMLAFRPGSGVTVPGREVISPTSGKNKGGKIRSEQTDMSPPRGTTSTTNVWQDIIDEMALAGLVKELAGHCVLKSHTADKVHLVLTPLQEHLLNKNQRDRLEKAIQTRFGTNVKVVITVEEPEAETPAQAKARIEIERQKAAVQSMQDDPNVKAIVEAFDATLDRDSVRPESG
jgi:DNA polymerase-3 subunit gamma/tau